MSHPPQTSLQIQASLQAHSLTHPQAQWCILRNHEGRYSVHPAAHDLPVGWCLAGGPDTRDACLAQIAETWTDMRPEVLKAAMRAEGAA